ncbi:MAG TPA: hypothetical protein VGM16_02900 [Gammaproteobacteria bacterium]|jgi:heme/copper-type cytochrome/quinol oxidase subunit 2
MAERITPASETSHPAPHRDRTSLFWLWFGIFAAPVAWNLQLLIATAVTGHACYPATDPLGPEAGAHLSGLMGWIDAIGVLIAIVALLVSIVHWRKVRREKQGTGQHLLDQGEGRTRFMAMLGILNSLLFLLALLFASANLFFFTPCP